MTETTAMHNKVSEPQDSLPSFDKSMLPEVIQSQIDKLNELDKCIKSALSAAKDAEDRAKKAGDKSAGGRFYQDKKKEAIEELQAAGIELAKAVQSGASAQEMAFEFQKRLVEVTKYLFSLGVSNVAVNRAVVRELEARLRDASEEELSVLAHQEILAVVMQLKEQEDLLNKQEELRKRQERMAEGLKAHDIKIVHVLAQTDDFDLRLQAQDDQQGIFANLIDGLGIESKQQKHEISTLQQQLSEQQARLNTLSSALALAEAHAEKTTSSLRSALNQRTVLLAVLVITLLTITYFAR
jgi:flagellar capping protein FliD